MATGTVPDEVTMARYRMDQVDQAPESPGLYAWYVKFHADRPDWELTPTADGDASIDGFTKLLMKYAGYFEPLPVTLQGRGSYGSKWSGSLELDFPLRPPEPEADSPNSPGLDPQVRERLKGAVESEPRRRVMSHILSVAVPVFSSPVYIGVAGNLRQRLNQHYEDFTDARDYLRTHPSAVNSMKHHGKNFGYRAAGRLIALERLEVRVMELGEQFQEYCSVENIREAAESAEWLMHRMFGPTLGRR